MRISISGAQNTGKSTLLKSFLYTWKNFTTPSKTYREYLTENKLQHSSKTTPETQQGILDFMLDQLQQYEKGSKVIYDRCPLDVLAYSMWAHDKGIDGFTKQYIDKQISIVRESMRMIDIIFLCKFDETQTVIDDGMRDTNIEYIKEIDNIFNSFFKQYTNNLHSDVFFPKDDSPCIIPLPHRPQNRVNLIAEYITPDGDVYGEETSLFNPDNIEHLEALVQQQKAALAEEEEEKALYKKFGVKYDR